MLRLMDPILTAVPLVRPLTPIPRLDSRKMSRLARLNYDTLFHILSHLNTRRSLLYLALTCRKMRDVVIPEFLYAHVEFGLGEGIEQLELLRISSFCKAVTSAQTTAGDAVRHIILKLDPQLFSTWRNAVGCMRNLDSLNVAPNYVDVLTIPILLDQKPKLRHLTISGCYLDTPYSLPGDLGGLRSIAIHDTNIPQIKLTRDSSLGNVLLNSRQTLQELRLPSIEWGLDTPAGVSDDTLGDLIWPHVHSLDLYLVRVSGGSAFTLSHSFPSTLHFTNRCWYHDPIKTPFGSRLRSLRGYLRDLQCISAAGSRLSRANLSQTLLFPHNIKYLQYLSSNLRSLSVRAHDQYTPDFLEELVVTTPLLSYLEVWIDIDTYRSCRVELVPSHFIFTHASLMPIVSHRKSLRNPCQNFPCDISISNGAAARLSPPFPRTRG